MEAKQKAKEFFDKFNNSLPLDDISKDRYMYHKKHAKNCALICIFEIRKEINEFDNEDGYAQSRLDFLDEVKEELEKI